MQNVTPAWEQTNRDSFTRPANMSLSFECTDGTSPIVSGSRLISFNYNKSGDPLSGILTQDTINFVFDNSDGLFTYDPENDKFTGASVLVQCGFMTPTYDSYDGINGGLYYVTDADSKNSRTSFTAKTIIAFMQETVDDMSGTCSEVVADIIELANANDGVPSSNIQYELDFSLDSVDVEIRKADNYSQAEVLQLIANACGCVLYVDRTGKICIKKLEQYTEHYVISGKISYEFPKVKMLEKIGRVKFYFNHGSGYGVTQIRPGAIQTVTNPIIVDDFDAMETMNNIYAFQQIARKRITGNFRADPRIDLFDVVAVPYLDKVIAGCITKINFTFNGAWRGTYEAVEIPNAEFDLRVCDLKMLTLAQIESMHIVDPHPNTISDIDGNYMATSNGELAFWKEETNE